MLFNSIDFAIFLPIVFIFYWSLTKNLKLQNLFIVIASYLFYGLWDWRFLTLMSFTTFFSWLSGILMLNIRTKETNYNTKTKLKLISASNIILNLSILGFFKYYNFFVENFVNAFKFLGQEINIQSLQIILPVGISFYTFQALSYSIDVYQKKIEPTKDIVSFFAFVSFFPQLVAGPIERATHLLPQFFVKRVFDYNKAVDGSRQILWGLFKKVVIADNCAEYANLIFNNYSNYSGSTLLLGSFFFTFQIYCDFSGYSDIAIGTSKLFGIDIMRNFNFPYFSRNIAEFWRRWHISLTTWFRDYIYFPLGGSRGSKTMIIRNTFIIYIVSGFWHGANWTFIIWGLYNALLFIPLILTGKNKKYKDTVATGKIFPTLKEIIKIGTTFIFIMVGWIFFRAENIAHAINYISEFFSSSLFTIPKFEGMYKALITIILICIFIIIEWIGREGNYAIEKLGIKLKRPMRYAIYYIIIIAIFWFWGNEQEFIYFQF